MQATGRSESGELQAHLLQERDRLQGEIEQLQSEIADKEVACRAKQQRLSHILALLGTEPPEAKAVPPRRAQAAGASTPTAQLLDMAEEALRRRQGEPMHYRDLADELIRRGAVIGGVDPAGGLVSRMTRDERFVRPTSKGFYALRADHPNARNVGAKRRGQVASQANQQQTDGRE